MAAGRSGNQVIVQSMNIALSVSRHCIWPRPHKQAEYNLGMQVTCVHPMLRSVPSALQLFCDKRDHCTALRANSNYYRACPDEQQFFTALMPKGSDQLKTHVKHIIQQVKQPPHSHAALHGPHGGLITDKKMATFVALGHRWAQSHPQGANLGEPTVVSSTPIRQTPLNFRRIHNSPSCTLHALLDNLASPH